MIRRERIHTQRWGWTRVAVLSALAATLTAVPAVRPLLSARSRREDLPTVVARRADLEVEVLAAGRVESAESTEIRCSLERLDAPGQGATATIGGASTILELVPDGSTVTQGDVLCQLDSSSYRELVRQQEILVKQAQADHRQAVLERDVAAIALRSYTEGERLQTEQQFRGQIALGKAEISRLTDRLAWTRRMLGKGYVSAAQVASETLSLKRSELNMAQTLTALDNYERYTFPKELLMLESQVAGAQATVDFQSIRLKKEEDRLSHYESLVERCTIRAPHDGFVIYANRPGRALDVYAGAPVRERMRLFYLPDLSQMEVGALLHETMVDRVRPGMKAHVRVEALPGREMEGEVVSITELPLFDKKSESGNDVTYFLGKIELTSLPAGLRPGMSAEVEILAQERRDVLTVPPVAVAVEDGQDVCYVAQDDRVERRPVKLGQSTSALVEILEGVNEGDEVVIDPELARSGLTDADGVD
jgi:HlyD family secretion protein